MIKSLLRSYLINLFALWAASYYLGSFHLSNGVESLFLIGLGFTLVHLTIEPLFQILLGPINFLSLGAVGLIVDSIMFYLLTLYFPQASVSAWNFPGANFYGFILPSFEFNLITGTILTALFINIIRRGLNLLAN